MRVLIFTHYLKAGGAERRATIYADYLQKCGIDVSVVTIYKTDNEYEINQEIPRFYLSHGPNEYSKLSFKRKVSLLRKIYDEFEPTTIISFLPKYSFYSLIASKYRKKYRHITNIYPVCLYQKKYKLITKMIDRFNCKHADIISLQCEEQLACNKHFLDKCIVNYNPISDRLSGLEKDFSKFKILCVGRLTKQKNFSFAIRGVAIAHKQIPNITLDLYGDGPLKKDLQKEIRRLKADKYIKLHNFSNKIIEEYSGHNVYISSSKYEGFPNSLIEAMMGGLVCLSTACPTGPKEIISDKINGFFIKKPEDIAKVLIELSKNVEICDNISKAARLSSKIKFEDRVVLPNFIATIKNR